MRSEFDSRRSERSERASKQTALLAPGIERRSTSRACRETASRVQRSYERSELEKAGRFSASRKEKRKANFKIILWSYALRALRF